MGMFKGRRKVGERQADATALLQNGVPGTGIIRMMGTPPLGARQFNLDLDLEVHVDGRDPYRVANTYMVPSTAQLGVGVELPIRVDRDDPAKIAIDWSQAPTAPVPGQIRPA